MKIIRPQQGSLEWLAHRRTVRNASDAPAMMGASPYVTRAELVRRVATGIVPEVDAATQRVFDRGHAVEPALRELAERMIGQDLYPVTAISDDGRLGASFDGVTLDESIILEAKQTNAAKMALVQDGTIPPQDYWQIVQQFAVCSTARTCYYLVGDGTETGTSWLRIERFEIEHDIPRLLVGWAQFDADVAAYQPEAAPAAVVAAPVAGFGALSLRVEGRVLASNLDSFRADAEAFIARLPRPTDLQTDQDFADAESAVKACAEAETRIKAAKDAALAQMADVDAVLRAADNVAETIRAARLALDRVVKAEKESRREALVRAGVDAVRAHYASVNATLVGFELGAPTTVQAEIGAAIKGLKSLESMRAKIDAAVAQAKIDASQEADRRRLSIAVLDQYAEHRGLLPDAAALVATKSPDDLRNLIVARVAEHEAKIRRQAEEAAERERERIRQEEAAKAQAEAQRAAEQAAATNTTQRALEVEQASRPADGGARDSTGELRAAGEPGVVIAKPPTPFRRVKLGEINAAIAPLSITADGLAQLGFAPVGNQGAAKLYDSGQFERIRAALIGCLQRADVTPRKAA